ncbi:MAG TPA: glycosyltransferase family 39 protein [Anaerolineae bacterium]
MKPNWEWPAVIGVLLVAAAFRLLALNDVPPGLHHDEVIIGQVAKDILRGHLAIYFTPGYGHEPLYHYLLAGMFAALGPSAFVLRLTSAFIAILGLAAAYRFARRLFSPAVAIGAMAWMAVTLWPIFFSRVGLRGILLPLLTTLTAYFLWKALRLSSNLQLHPSSLILHPSPFIPSGVFLGLSIYTYQASRVFPVIFLLVTFYVAVFHRDLFRRTRRGLIVFFAVAAFVTAPLVVYLTAINPGAEARIAELSGPLNKLAEGDPGEVVLSTLNTLGMFTIAGDHVPIYNAGGRPVFPEPIGAVLFTIGLILCLRRWRQPAYALMLIWLIIGLVPAMVTPFSPNFVRTIAVWPIPFILCGIAMLEVSQFISRQLSLLTAHCSLFTDHLSLFTAHCSLVFALVLAFNAVLTARDYFFDWPRGDYVRFWYQATWTQAVRALNADPSSAPVAASGLSINDFDPQTFDLLGMRPGIKVKWFDCRSAILYPGGGSGARYLSPDFFPCDADLWSRYLADAVRIAQPRWADSGNVIFTLHQLPVDYVFRDNLATPPSQPVYLGAESFDAARPSNGLEPIQPPIDFEGLRFLGQQMDRLTVKVGETFDFDTFWEITAPVAPPLKLFVHVTAPDGSIVAQADSLDVAIAQSGPGDVFVQRHRLSIPPDALASPYRISIGAYHPDIGARLIATVGDRPVDVIVLGVLSVE